MAKDKGGRPTDYKPEFAQMAYVAISESGFSMPQLCKLFGVKARSTIYKWREDHKEFSDAVKRGRKFYEGDKIHKALVKRAVGFRYQENTYEYDTEGKPKLVKRVSKFYPPETAAIKHWQVNCDPDNWKDTKRFEGNLTIGEAIKELEEEGRPEPEADE